MLPTQLTKHAPGLGPVKQSCRDLERQASSAKLREPQAASIKPQAASIKLQAASSKRLDLLSFIKFHGSMTEALGYDKRIQRMFHMERNLVW